MTMAIWEDWLVKINNDFRKKGKKEKKAKLTNVHGSLLVDFLIEKVSEPMESGLIMPNVKQCV